MSLLIPSALRRISVRTFLLQVAGNALLLLLSVAWLNIPDSHIWQLTLSVLLGTMLLAAFLALHVTSLRRLRPAAGIAPLWLGMLLLPAWLVLLRILELLTAHLNDGVYSRAGYWNSQLGPYLRTVFTYSRLDRWQNDLINVLIWVVLPALVLPLLIETCVCGFSGWRNGLRVLRRWQHWLTVSAAAWAGCWFTSLLLGWLPGHGVRGELISVVLRVTLVYLVDILLAIAVLVVIAELLARSDAPRDPAP